jgi:hypothetical protein
METTKILSCLAIAVIAANLLHWHGSGRYYFPFPPLSGAKKVIQIIFRVIVLLLVTLACIRILPFEVVLGIVFAILLIQETYSMWRRHGERVQARAKPSASYEGSSVKR